MLMLWVCSPSLWGVFVCFQELLGMLCHRRGWPHSWMGASVPLPWLYQVGAPGLSAALGWREAARQQHSSRCLPAVQCRIPHCVSQTGWVKSYSESVTQVMRWRSRQPWRKSLLALYFLLALRCFMADYWNCACRNDKTCLQHESI